jgi:GTPase
VPVGTVVKKLEELDRVDGARKFRETIIADMDRIGDRIVIDEGGKGGRGNTTFKSSTNQAPRTREEGIKRKDITLKLELKLIADVGLVGYPNAGKSTLLSKLSNARPKIASYPFTTLEPYLGIVQDEYKRFVLADLPGLIEGAHLGKGLGHKFLRHTERTRVILHVVDMSGYDDKDPIKNFHAINKELEEYGEILKDKIQIVAANKIDIEGTEKSLESFTKKITKEGYKVIPVSGETGEGLEELKKELFKILKQK